MYNTSCNFNKKTGEAEFEEMKWMMPIQAMTKVKMTEVVNKKIEMVITINGDVQNNILQKFGQKKVKKNERDVEFAIAQRTTAREFLWHLNRIHHWWNCAGEDKKNNPPLEIEVKEK